MANIKDVARKAGVSIATVSHVINGTRFVSKEATEKVHQAIMELNYSPNALANSLRTKKSKTIGLVIPIGHDENSNIFIMQIVLGIDSILREKGYSALLANSRDDLRYEKDAVKDLITRQIEGLIIAPALGDYSEMRELLNGREYIFVDRRPEGMDGEDVILSDSQAGSFEAVRKMIEYGHSKIGILCEPIGKYPNSDLRFLGYKKAMQEAGLEIKDSYIRGCEANLDAGYIQTKWLIENTEITALFAVSNTMGMGAVKYIQQSKKKIPDDISITVFDDCDWTAIYNPPLSTIRQDGYEMGKKSAQILLQRLDNQEYPKKEYKLPTQLIIRDSWKRIRNEPPD